MTSWESEQFAEIVENLDRGGFSVVRSFLDPALVRGMHAEITPILSAHYERYKNGDRSESRGVNRLAIDLKPYMRVSAGPLADPRYARNAIVEQLVRRTFGRMAPVWRGWTQVECVWPGSQNMSWHGDQMLQYTPRPHSPNRTIRMTYNIPLVRCTASNGAMQIVPGSHRRPRAARPPEEFAESDFETLELEIGDVVLRDSHTLHRGTVNQSDEPRPLLDQTYHRVTAKLGLHRLYARASQLKRARP